MTDEQFKALLKKLDEIRDLMIAHEPSSAISSVEYEVEQLRGEVRELKEFVKKKGGF